MLIALNPCSNRKRHSLLNIFENEDVQKFVEISKRAKDLNVNQLEPHILSVGVKSLYSIGKVGNNQVIVVSGYVLDLYYCFFLGKMGLSLIYCFTLQRFWCRKNDLYSRSHKILYTL